MMRWAFPTSAAYVPEVSISIYTAWVWLRWSVQVDADNPSSDARSKRFTMVAPIYAARLTALDEQREDDRDVVYADQHPAQLPYEVAENTQHERSRADEHYADRPAHRPQRIDEGLERDRHESQREGQEEAEEHLRRGRDEPEQGIGRTHLRACERPNQGLLLGGQHVAHQGERRLDSREDEEKDDRGPEHA